MTPEEKRAYQRGYHLGMKRSAKTTAAIYDWAMRHTDPNVTILKLVEEIAELQHLISTSSVESS